MSEFQSIDNYILLLAGLSHISIGMIVLFRNKRQLANIGFLVFAAGMGVWVLSNYFIDFFFQEDYSLFFARLSGTGVIMFVVGLDIFANHYEREATLSTRERVTLLTGGVLAILSTFTNFVSMGVDLSKFPAGVVHNPTGYMIVIAFILFQLVYSFWILFKRTSEAVGKFRTQLLTISTVLFGLTIVAMVTNLLLPNLLSTSALTRIGPASTALFTTAVAFVIARYQFLDVRILLGRLSYFTVMAVIPYGAFFGLAWIYESIVGTIFHPSVYFISLFVSVLFVSVFDKANSYIRNQVTSRLINPGYNPLEVADQYANELSPLLELGEITDKLIYTMGRTLKPEFTVTLVFSPDKNSPNDLVFAPGNFESIDYGQLKRIAEVIWDAIGALPLAYNTIEADSRPGGKYWNIPNLSNDLKNTLELLSVRVILPISTKDKIRGLVLIGQREADTPYIPRDIEFLQTIASATSVAIERSLLYTEVQNFANTLQEKVNVATAELQEANQSLQTTLSQLQEIRRRERDMIDVMGHELRTPMSIVRNAMSLLEREYNKHDGQIPPDKLKKYLDMGVESAKREITLIETLLSATKVDASRIQLYLTKVDLKDVISDSFDGHTEQLSEKGLELKYIPPENDIFIFCDRTRIQQVMDNFLSNAIKYTPQGFIEIKAWEDATNGWVSIKDSGIGIDEEDLRNLGKKFFRAKQYIPKQEEGRGGIIRPGGTGLGLYVTFELIRVMGGTLYINSKVGEGTSFTWSMPRFSNQPDKQTDQTFDEPQDIAPRNHIILNGQVPQPN